MRARIHVMPKRGVLDPQGRAIARALEGLGFQGIGEARQGKVIEIELAEDDPVRAREHVAAMCERLLANPVVEDYVIELA